MHQLQGNLSLKHDYDDNDNYDWRLFHSRTIGLTRAYIDTFQLNNRAVSILDGTFHEIAMQLNIG